RFLRDVVAALYRRHDALRLRFTDAGAKHHELSDAMIDASAIVEPWPADLTARCSEYQQAFDLERGPLFRAIHFVGGRQSCLSPSGRLFLLAHHIVVDGLSWPTLLADLEHAYHQHKAGQPIA